MNKTYLAVVLSLAVLVMIFGVAADVPFLTVCSGIAIVVSAVVLKPPSSFL